MPDREWCERVDDILLAVNTILAYVHDLDEISLGSNPQVVDAVLFNFIIIGESANRLPFASGLEERYSHQSATTPFTVNIRRSIS